MDSYQHPQAPMFVARRFFGRGFVVLLLLAALTGSHSVYGQQRSQIRRLPPLDVPEPTLDPNNLPLPHRSETLPPPAVDDLDAPPGPDLSVFDGSFGQPPPISSDWDVYWSWLSPKMWHGTVEVGINGSEGNAQSFSIRAGGNLTRETDRTKSVLDITYGKTQANSDETQHNALLDARIDWKLGESPWSVFKRFGLEYDEFKAFDVRLRVASGLGYDLWKSEISKLTGRFGGATSREIGGVDETWVPEANFGVDYERKISARQKFVATLDYYPAWADFNDFRMVADVGWEVLLDDVTNMSLKFGVIDRYDSTPNGALANDVDYSVLLLWKL